MVFTPKPLFHFGNPVFVLRDLYEDILQRFGYDFPVASSFTGSGGRRFADCLSVPYHHDTIAIPAGAAHLDPGARYIFHMGARDAYFFEIEKIHTGQGHHTFVPDHGTGTKCGGGSGILVTKQCRRFFEHEFPMDLSGKTDRDIRRHLNERLCRIFQRGDEEIRKSDKHLDVGGRCGVVIQSDMIHLQNSGEKVHNILAGLYQRVMKNFQSDVLKSRVFDPSARALASGGLFESSHIAKMAGKTLGFDVTVHPHFRHLGAMGAVIRSLDSTACFTMEDLDRLGDSEKKTVKTVGALKNALGNVRIYPEEEPVETLGDLKIYAGNDGENIPVI